MVSIYAAIDAETRGLIAMMVHATRNCPTTLDFVRRVIKFCSNRDFEIITDSVPCYEQVCKRLGIKWRHETFRKRNCVEHALRSFMFFTMRFNHLFVR